MPKLIDYPRTSYTGAWEVAEVVDDTGGKCALDTCARKLNRKVSGSFKAIVGSAVKFGLLTSKRELLTTTTLFRRIKHAYDKQEELTFHREAFLTPPLFTQLCRKFRSRELPVAMLDVLLIREFGVEEINAQGVAKAFIDGARMIGILDEHHTIADIDQLAAQQPPRRELASPPPPNNVFRQSPNPVIPAPDLDDEEEILELEAEEPSSNDAVAPKATPPAVEPTKNNTGRSALPLPASRPAPAATTDAIAHLFGLNASSTNPKTASEPPRAPNIPTLATTETVRPATSKAPTPEPVALPMTMEPSGLNELRFRIQLAGPGINTQLDVVDVDDLGLVRALLDKIERQLRKG